MELEGFKSSGRRCSVPHIYDPCLCRLRISGTVPLLRTGIGNPGFSAELQDIPPWLILSDEWVLPSSNPHHR